jgi:hypothetical protein
MDSLAGAYPGSMTSIRSTLPEVSVGHTPACMLHFVVLVMDVQYPAKVAGPAGPLLGVGRHWKHGGMQGLLQPLYGASR